MTFIARIRQHSPIWHRWHGEARTGGVLYGVQFAWEPGNIYRTLPLSAGQIDILRTHDSIDLEVVSSDAAVAASVVPAAVAAPARPVAAPATPVYVNARRRV